MVSSSLTAIGIMVMVNVLLISNYLFIRKLRETIDTHNDEAGPFSLWRQALNDNRLFAGLRAFRRSFNTIAAPNSTNRITFPCVRNSMYAFLLGKQRLEPTSSAVFPDWQPIPYRMGTWSTALSLLLMTYLLSGDMIPDKISVDANRDNSTGLCATTDFDEKIDVFSNHVMTNITKYHIGNKQKKETLKFRDALLNDTTLYGEPGYKCPDDEIGTKEGYKDKKKHLENGAFFPGYCEASLDLALKNAMALTCTEPQWVCWDDWGSCIFGVWLELPISCPPHTYDAEVDGLKNYRVEQQKRREQEPITIENNVSSEDLEKVKSSSADVIKKILRQVDIAGTLYNLYICVSLFFPTPLQLYKPSISVKCKKMFFGAGKYTFMIVVLAIWWGYDRLGALLQTPEVKIYLKNVVTDPCFLDGDFINKRYEIVQEICSELIEFKQEWGLAKVQIDAIKPEVDAFRDKCKCNFPGKYVYPRFSSDDLIDMESIGFDKSLWGASTVWSPRTDSQFLGNETICLNKDYATDEILVADETGLSFWELWIGSGLMANLLIRIAIANFGVALLKLADPFCICKGEYECPPTAKSQLGEDTNEEESSTLFVNNEIKEIKASSLKAIAVRETVIWGFITNSCLLSLLVVASSNFQSYKNLDYIFFGVVMLITVLIPCLCFLLTKRLNRVVEYDLQQQGEVGHGRA